jgi:hypothetical protein
MSGGVSPKVRVEGAGMSAFDSRELDACAIVALAGRPGRDAAAIRNAELREREAQPPLEAAAGTRG